MVAMAKFRAFDLTAHWDGRRGRWFFLGALSVLLSVVLVVSAVAVAHNRQEETPSAHEAVPSPIDKLLRVALIGDEFTGGTIAGGVGRANWSARTARRLFHEGYPVAYSTKFSAGAGYAQRGPTVSNFYDESMAAVNTTTQMTIVFGGINDRGVDAELVRSGASQVYGRILEIAPDSEIVVIGPAWINGEVPADVSLIRDVLASEAAKVDAEFIDPLSLGWFSGRYASLISSDGRTPSDQGHAYLEENIFPKLLPIVARVAE